MEKPKKALPFEDFLNCDECRNTPWTQIQNNREHPDLYPTYELNGIEICAIEETYDSNGKRFDATLVRPAKIGPAEYKGRIYFEYYEGRLMLLSGTLTKDTVIQKYPCSSELHSDVIFEFIPKGKNPKPVLIEFDASKEFNYHGRIVPEGTHVNFRGSW